jgi:hypothetical protein
MFSCLYLASNSHSSLQCVSNQKWFDLNLKKMRTNLINYGKMFSKYPKDPYIRNHFYKLQREYNITRKQTYREYKKSLLSQLETLHSG